MAYDIDRDDWRTFRVDRVSEPFATGARFTPRELPAADAAEYLSRSMAGLQPTYRVVAAFEAPAEFVAARLPRWLGMPVATGDTSCRLDVTTADSLEWVAFRLALVDCEFAVHEPPALIEHLRELGARISRAAG
ncbi:hypothetical protein GCM10020000_47180 [Streptomyces olivoverticillatus]